MYVIALLSRLRKLDWHNFKNTRVILCASTAQDLADLAPIDQTLEKEHHERTKVKNIQVIELGRYEVRACPSALHVFSCGLFEQSFPSGVCSKRRLPCLCCCSHLVAQAH